jgi:hypothetical protein
VKREVLGILAGALLAFAAAPASADYLQPRSSSDCNLYTPAYPFKARLDAIDARASQCEQSHSQLGWTSACGHYGPNTCLPIYQQTCTLRDQMARIEAQCRQTLENWKIREAAEARRREAEEQARKDSRRFLNEAGARTGHKQEPYAALRDGQALPLEVSDRLRHARGLPGPGGAEKLSRAFVKHGTARMQDIQAAALAYLEGAASSFQLHSPPNTRGYSAANPRRSASQLDRALHSRTTQLQRIEAMQDLQAAGGTPPMDSAYSVLMTQIVEAQANGTLPADSLDAVTRWIASEVERAETERGNAERARVSRELEALLPQQRALANAAFQVLDERRRQDEARRRAAEQEAARQRGNGASGTRSGTASGGGSSGDPGGSRYEYCQANPHLSWTNCLQGRDTPTSSSRPDRRNSGSNGSRNNCGSRTCGVF